MKHKEVSGLATNQPLFLRRQCEIMEGQMTWEPDARVIVVPHCKHWILSFLSYLYVLHGEKSLQ